MEDDDGDSDMEIALPIPEPDRFDDDPNNGDDADRPLFQNPRRP